MKNPHPTPRTIMHMVQSAAEAHLDCRLREAEAQAAFDRNNRAEQALSTAEKAFVQARANLLTFIARTNPTSMKVSAMDEFAVLAATYRDRANAGLAASEEFITSSYDVMRERNDTGTLAKLKLDLELRAKRLRMAVKAEPCDCDECQWERDHPTVKDTAEVDGPSGGEG